MRQEQDNNEPDEPPPPVKICFLSYTSCIGGLFRYFLTLGNSLSEYYGLKVSEIHPSISYASNDVYNPNMGKIKTYLVKDIVDNKKYLRGLKFYQDFVKILLRPSKYGRNTKKLFNGEEYACNKMLNNDYAKAVREIVARTKQKIIHAHGFSALSLIKQLNDVKPKILYTSHAPFYSNIPKRARKWIINGLEAADYIVALTPKDRENMIEVGIDKKIIKQIFPPVDTDMFKPQRTNMRSKFGIDKNEKIILYPARMHQLKGHKYLIKAFSIILKTFPQSKMLFIGDGDKKYEKKMRKLAKKMRLENRIIFGGQFYGNDVPKIYNMSDVVAVPSISEGFCYGVAEALSCERPVVTSDTRGALNQVKDGKNGYIVGKRDSESMAERICDIFSNPKKAERMAQKGRKTVLKKFDKRIVSEKYMEIYKELIEN